MIDGIYAVAKIGSQTIAFADALHTLNSDSLKIGDIVSLRRHSWHSRRWLLYADEGSARNFRWPVKLEVVLALLDKPVVAVTVVKPAAALTLLDKPEAVQLRQAKPAAALTLPDRPEAVLALLDKPVAAQLQRSNR